MKTVDELMRLASQHASAHAEWVLKGSDAATQEDATYAALRSALEEVVRDADRYRALRHSLSGAAGCSHTEMPRISAPFRPDLTYAPDGLDRAIDAAMQQAPEQEG